MRWGCFAWALRARARIPVRPATGKVGRNPPARMRTWFLGTWIRISLQGVGSSWTLRLPGGPLMTCLLYTSDAADDLLCVDLGGRRIIKKKKKKKNRI